MHSKKNSNSNPRSWFAVDVPVPALRTASRIARNTALTSLNTSADSAVHPRSGTVGAQLISVKDAIDASVKVTT